MVLGLVSGLILPVIIAVFGAFLKKYPPKQINSLIGFRTPKSSLSQYTWDYANEKCAAYMLNIGLFTIIQTIVLLLVVLLSENIAGKTPDGFELTSAFYTLILMLYPMLILVVEFIYIITKISLDLRRLFDEKGMPKSGKL